MDVIATIAAVAAAFFAWRAVVDTGELRREDRLARLPDLVEEVVRTALRSAQGGQPIVTGYPIATARLKAAVAASGESLPVCLALAEENLLALSLNDIVARGEAAVDELTPLLRSVR